MKRYSAISIALLLMLIVSYGEAASVREVSIDEMLQKSQLVFEGTAVAFEVRENAPKRIHTYVSFEIKDIIKGEYPSNIIKLRFLGGTMGNVTMTVSDMRLPQKGEHGIYFVESLERSQVNPLYGWSQGHFVVEHDPTGNERVMTNNRLAVTGVTENSADAQMTPAKQGMQALSRGIARDIIVGQEKKGNISMTVDEFKRVLHKRLERIQ